MSIITVITAAACTVFTALILKKYSPETALLVSLAGAVCIALVVSDEFSRMLLGIQAIFPADEKYLIIPLKALGITLLSAFTSRLCEDAGEKAVAFTVILAGKTAVLITALPLFSELTELLMRILKLE